MEYIEITMKSSRDWSGGQKALELVEVLTSAGGFFMPEKADTHEPERFDFGPHEVANLWAIATNTLFHRRKPYDAYLMIERCYRESRRFNSLMGGYDSRYFNGDSASMSRLLGLAKRFYNWGEVAHGYICHRQERRNRNYVSKMTEVAGGWLPGYGGVRLTDHLPGVYWANFFCPAYVAFFGCDKFRTVPAWYKEELPNGGFLLLTAATPFEYEHEEVIRLQEMIVDHLGRDAFFDKSCPERICRAPGLAFEQEAYGKPIYVTEEDTVSEVIPDVIDFVESVPKLAQNCVQDIGAELDYSAQSLEIVDDYIIRRSRTQKQPWKTNKGRQLLQHITAYFGEVLRRDLNGRWEVGHGSSGLPHPTISHDIGQDMRVEYPYARVIKMWSERQRADGLAIWYYLARRRVK